MPGQKVKTVREETASGSGAGSVIPGYSILARIGLRAGFELKGMYVYDVINRHLDIPRWNNSRIEKDHIIVFQRRRAPATDRL